MSDAVPVELLTRLQGHTEVLLNILSFADPSAILSCLRVSRRYHALAYKHIDILYRHVYIDRDTVDSVFRGILWERIEEKWTVPFRPRDYWTDDEDNYDEDGEEYGSDADHPDDEHAGGESEEEPDDQGEWDSNALARLSPTWEPSTGTPAGSDWIPSVMRLRTAADDSNHSSDLNASDSDSNSSVFSGSENRYGHSDHSADYENELKIFRRLYYDCFQSDGDLDDEYGSSINSEGESNDTRSLSPTCSAFNPGFDEDDELDDLWRRYLPRFGLDDGFKLGDSKRERESRRTDSERAYEEDSQFGRRKRSRWVEDESDSEREWSYASEDTDSGKDERSASEVGSTNFNSTSSEADDVLSDDESIDYFGHGVNVESHPELQKSNPGSDAVIERAPSPVPSSQFHYEYSSDADTQHMRKLHALSTCRVLTSSDASYLGAGESRPHSHETLHNGKAHQLLSSVTTIRVLPPTRPKAELHEVENHGIENICDFGRNCRFVRELSPSKLVHSNVGVDIEDLHWGWSVEELTLFLPFGGWTKDSHCEYYSDDEVFGGIARLQAKTTKLIFGPYIKRGGRTRAPYPKNHRDAWPAHHSSRKAITSIIRIASRHTGHLTVYGMERVKVVRDSYDDCYSDDQNFDTSPWRKRWYRREHKRNAYGPQESADRVRDQVDRPSSRASRNRRPAPIEYQTIEQYTALKPDDELFDCELDSAPARINGKWLSSNYWKSKSLWSKTRTLPELGEGDFLEPDTDEDKVVRQSPQYPFSGYTRSQIEDYFKDIESEFQGVGE